MANGKGIRIRVWKEGGNVLVRSDILHITTYGKTTQQALGNFKEALTLTLDAMTEMKLAKKQAFPFEFDLGMPGSGFYGRASKSKATGAC